MAFGTAEAANTSRKAIALLKTEFLAPFRPSVHGSEPARLAKRPFGLIRANATTSPSRLDCLDHRATHTYTSEVVGRAYHVDRGSPQNKELVEHDTDLSTA